MAKNEKDRFIKQKTGSLGFGENTFIIVDKKTGVNYFFVQSGYAVGLTPLLDRDGRPVVTSTYQPPGF